MTDLAYKTVALVVLFLALVLNACDFQKYEPSAPSPTQTASLLDIAERYVSGAIAHPEALCGPFSSYGGFRSNFIHWTPDGSSLIFNEKEPYYPYDGGVIKMASVEGLNTALSLMRIPTTNSKMDSMRTCPQMARLLCTLRVSLLLTKDYLPPLNWKI